MQTNTQHKQTSTHIICTCVHEHTHTFCGFWTFVPLFYWFQTLFVASIEATFLLITATDIKITYVYLTLTHVRICYFDWRAAPRLWSTTRSYQTFHEATGGTALFNTKTITINRALISSGIAQLGINKILCWTNPWFGYTPLGVCWNKAVFLTSIVTALTGPWAVFINITHISLSVAH